VHEQRDVRIIAVPYDSGPATTFAGMDHARAGPQKIPEGRPRRPLKPLHYCVSYGRGVESPFVTGPEDRTATLTEASLLLAVLFLGTNPVAVKTAVAELPSLPFVATRFTVAGLLLLGLVALLDTGGRPNKRDLVSMAGVGLVGVGANNVAFTLGVGMTAASTTALLYAAVPVWGILLGLALGFERPTLGGLSGVCLAFVGVGVVVYGGLGEGGTSLVGDLLVVVATVCWGSYAVLSLPLLRRHTPLVVAAYTMLFGGLGAVPLALPGLVVVSVAAGVGLALAIWNPTEPDESAAVLGIRQLNELATVEYTTQVLVTEEENAEIFRQPSPEFLTGEQLLLVAVGEVQAGVDLDSLGPEDVSVVGKTVTIDLPEARILGSSLNEDKTRLYDRDRALLKPRGNDELIEEARPGVRHPG
jgi:drug/metabolite transporter (DMT)-like permease